MKAPVAIVVPCRNRPEELERLLASLATLDPGPAEVLIVDDGSAPPLTAPGAKTLRFETSVGPAAAKNRGAAATEAEFILFMDSDTEVVDPKLLARMLAVFRERPDAGIVGGEWLFRDGGWQIALRRFEGDGRLETRLERRHVPLTSEVSHISSSNLMMRRDVFLRLGGYWEPYVYIMEDTDLCFLARASGMKVYTGSDVAVRHFRTATARVPGFVRRMNLRNQALFHWCWDRPSWALSGLAAALASQRAYYAVTAAVSAAAVLPAAGRRRRALRLLPEGVWG